MKGLFACIFAVLFLSSVVEASHFGSITGLAIGDPDLEVIDVKFSSSDPTKSGVTVVTATVRNSGYSSSIPSSVVIDLGLRRPWTFNVPVLAPGASMSFQVTPWLAVGSHSFAVYADSENQVSESNKLNNQVVDSLYIGKPSLALAEGSTSVTPSRLPFFTSPDLVVSDIIFSPEQPVTGDVVGANITVQNIGSAASDPSVLYVSGTRSGTWKLPVGALDPGESVVVNIPQLRPWFSLGVYTFTARADVNGQVSEVDERNNVLQKTLIVSLPVLGVSATAVSDKGNLTVLSDPSGARVYVDNIFKGVTPVTVSGLSAGRHVVNLTKDLFFGYNTTVNIDISSPLALSASLDSVRVDMIVSSVPSGASVYLDGVLEGVAPVTIPVRYGTYSLRLTKKYYQDRLYEVVNDLSSDPLNVNLEMVPKVITLSVSSVPSGASVYLDGVLKGVSPLDISSVNAGIHSVKVSKKYYDDYNNANVDVDNDVSLPVTLINKIVTLSVTSVPSGASVFVDGVNKGVSPVSASVNAGVHSVRLSKKYYNDYNNANVDVDGDMALPATLTSKIVTLSVSSNPSGAAVYLDGVSKGVTPLSISSVPAGIHSLRLTKKYYNDYNNANVDLDADTSLPVTMTNKVVTLSASSSPSGATLFVDGVNKGVTPVSTSFNAGVHSVRVSKAKYYDYTTTLDMDGPASVSPTLSLKPGILSVNSVPEGATVYVNNVNRGTTPVSISMSQGSYTLKLTKTNYGDISNSVIINADATTTANWNLPMLNRKMYLYSNPSGANFVVTAYDLRATGVTPGVIDMKCTYQHSVTMSKDGYFDATQSGIYTDSTCAPISISLTLVPASPTPSASTGTLSVTSTPVSGSVSIDNVNKGTTPVSLTLNQGTYTVKVTNSGYQDYSTSASVAAGRTTTVSATLPTRANMLYVYSNPSGASVSFRYYETSYGWHTVNAGMSPAAIQLYAGWSSMSVTLSKAGYKSATYSEGSSGWNSYRNQYGQYTYEVNVNLVPN